MGKILALDLGKKRVGVAVSDELKILALPLMTIDIESLEDSFLGIIDEHDIEKIIVGLPRKMDGSLGEMAEEVIKMTEKLRRLTDLPFETEDETLTSQKAEGRLKKRGVNIIKDKSEIDKEAAAIILESYLERI